MLTTSRLLSLVTQCVAAPAHSPWSPPLLLLSRHRCRCTIAAAGCSFRGVDLFPARSNRFARASCRQQGELERKPNRLSARRFPNLRDKGGSVRQLARLAL